MNNYFEGTLVEVRANFTDLAGAPADPSTVVLKVEKPDGTTATYTYALAELTKAGTGVYTRNLEADQPNLWYYRFIGTGAVKAASQKEFRVLPARPA